MRNCFVGYRGGSYSRAGTKFVGFSKQNPAVTFFPPRIVSFEFSLTQNIVLEFGDFYLRFIVNGGMVVETGKVITGASQANPCQITSVGHGFSNGNWVVITGVGGMTQLNGNTYIVAGVAANTFTLTDLDGNAINSTGYGAYTGGGLAERIYEIVTPYSQVDLPLLKFVQSADVISITHRSYPPYDLARLGATNWTLTPTAFAASISAPSTVTAVANTHPSSITTPPTLPAAYAYVVTAIDPRTGQESIASPIANVTDSVNMAVTAATIILSWVPVVGAEFYNIYRAPVSYNTAIGGPATNSLPVPIGSIFGFLASSFGNQFFDTNIDPDFSKVPPLHRNPFAPGQILSVTMGASSADWTTATPVITTSTGTGFIGQCVIIGGAVTAVVVDSGGQLYANGDTISFTGDGTSASATLVVGPATGTYPGVVDYFQQRRVYANSTNQPDTLWASQPGAFTNFDSSIPVTDADAITASPWSQQVNGIQWLVPMPLGLVVFMGNGVWQIGASGGAVPSSPAAITPANNVAVPQNSYGSSENVPPIKINSDILYLQSHGSTVRDLSYQIFFNSYTGTDVSWQSQHLLLGHTLDQWTWCDEPYKIIWAQRSDGMGLSLTYLKEQEVTGWARHDTQGVIVSVCSVTELPVDALYWVARRQGSGGQQRFFIERMDNRIWPSVEDVWAVDCGLGTIPTMPNTSIFATAGSGAGVTFVTSTPVFSITSVGQVIRMGGGIALITNFVNGTTVLGDWYYPCQEITPNDPSNVPLGKLSGDWSISPQITTVSGLAHLAGKQVTGLADGFVITPRTVSPTGTITLDHPASKVIVGLAFTAQLQSVYLDTGQPTIQGRRVMIPAVTVRVEASSVPQAKANQLDASAQSPPPLFETWSMPPASTPQNLPATYQTPGGATVRPLFTGDMRVIIPSDWAKGGQIAVQQTLPLPLQVTAFIPEVNPGDVPEMELPPRRAPQQQRSA
jgi:hypothetical protein